MAVFLGILKIIGIVLLIILAVILVLLCLILFVPVRYEADGHKDGKDMNGKVRITYLLHAVSFTIGYGIDGKEGVTKELRLFGIRFEDIRNFFRNLKKGRHRRQHRRRLQKIRKKDPARFEEMKAEAKARKEEKADKVSDGETEQHISRDTSAEHKTGPQTDEETRQEEHTEAQEFMKEPGTRKSLWIVRVLTAIGKKAAVFFGFFLKTVFFFYELPGRIADAIGKMISKIAAVCATINKWAGFLTDPRTRNALKIVKKKVGSLLHHVRPRKLSGKVCYGLEDPAKTGTILAGISALYPFYGGKVEIVPNFEEKELNGHLEMKGRIFLFYVVWIALTAYFNRNVRYVIGFIKEVKGNG